ncbi:porin [Pedobacter sandarakinus]|uniref:porin n=1 Tax=Pedobacter sandarakinus TaxID=353156 RepID=UPI00224645E9|nr:porin [Pedobacter sandarakinus]MCX2572902.1 porin [Pedobacter sandarakinus]
MNLQLISIKLKLLLPAIAIIMISSQAFAQRTINDVMDSTTVNHLLIISKKYGSLSFSGYMQPQFQAAQSNGTLAEYQGGNFGEFTNNRFRLRRGRLRADYMMLTEDGAPSTYFVLQFDGTEQGVNIRDFWGRYYENKWKILAVTLGLSGRPFGNELQLSSSVREAPERGRMSQILMKTERDLGVTFTFNPRWKDAKLKNIVFDLGIYNGQGLAGPAEFDNSKDVILRLSHKPYVVKGLPFSVAGGISTLQGGLNHRLPVSYKMEQVDQLWKMVKDSSSSTINKVAPRRYYGADIQFATTTESWKSELRAELISGLQTGTSTTSTTPGSYPVDNKAIALPYYTRNFSGAYITFVQTLNSTDNQIILKYDYYDPNTKVKGFAVNSQGLSAADVRFDTFGFGFLHHFNPHFKAVLYYDVIRNEATQIPDYTSDRKDNIFTLRTQFYF